MRRLFENSFDAIMLHDLKGNIINVNNSACELLKYTKNELLKINMSKLHPESEEKDFMNSMKSYKMIRPSRIKTKLIKKDKSVINVEVSINFLDYDKGQILGIIRESE